MFHLLYVHGSFLSLILFSYKLSFFLTHLLHCIFTILILILLFLPIIIIIIIIIVVVVVVVIVVVIIIVIIILLLLCKCNGCQHKTQKENSL